MNIKAQKMSKDEVIESMTGEIKSLQKTIRLLEKDNAKMEMEIHDLTYKKPQAINKVLIRLWDDKNKKMIDPYKITPLILNTEQDGVFLPFDIDMILLPWAGLTDQNGKYVYVGDILSNGDCDSRWVVCWDDFSYPNLCDGMKNMEICSSLPIDQTCKKMRIIGNRFENPQLIIK